MKKLFGVWVLVLVPLALQAENREAALTRVTRDVSYLASDELEGRGVETAGNLKAARYIREAFEQNGLKPGLPDGDYFQPFTISLGQNLQSEQTHLTLIGPDEQKIELQAGSDFEVLFLGGPGAVQAPLVFAGYGIAAPDLDYDDYAGLDVKGKVVLILRKEPQQNDQDSAFEGTETTPFAYVRTKIKAAADAGAAAVLLVNDPTTVTTEEKDELAKPSAFGNGAAKLPFGQVSQVVVNRVLATSPLKAKGPHGEAITLNSLAAVEENIDMTGSPISQPLSGWNVDLRFAFTEKQKELVNVVGVLPGAGPNANEVVVVGAHFDHIGYGETGSRKPNSTEIHNGADDNASGTAALLELVRRLSAGPAPARTVLFLAFNGEERGLLGSAHFVEASTVPLEKIVAMVNFDMVGRLGDSPLLVYGTGSATEFPELVAEVQKSQSGYEIKPVSGVMGASDHYSFYLKKIPVFHLFTGLSKEYHTPEDDVQTLNLPGITQSVDFAEVLTRRLIADKRPTFVATATESPSRGDMAYLGVVPDYSGMGDGLKLNGVSDGSPAQTAGLQADDVITQFGEVPIGDIQGLADALRRYKAGETHTMTVQRDGKEVQVSVTLGASKRSAK